LGRNPHSPGSFSELLRKWGSTQGASRLGAVAFLVALRENVMNLDKRAEQLKEYLRGLSATLADPMLEDAADLIDELLAAVFVEAEKVAQYEAPEPKEHPLVRPGDGAQLRALIEKTGRRPPMAPR